MRRLLLPLLLILVCIPAVSQNWSGILSPKRAMDWSRAGANIQDRNTICQTVSAGATAAQIESAIANCPAGQAVKLGAGTFNIGGITITKSNVTLKGSGPLNTILVFSSPDGCVGLDGGNICIMNPSATYSASSDIVVANVSGTLTQGTNTVTLSTTNKLTVGKMMVIDQLKDSSDPGDIWVCNTINVCTNEGDNYVGRGNGARPQSQAVVVTAINGTQVTFSPALRMPNWRADRSPQAYWGDQQVSGVGIEDLTLNNTNSGGAGILISWAKDIWVRNVRSIDSGRAQIWFYNGMNLTIKDSYFRETQGNLSQSYGYEPLNAHDVLIQNNIFERVPLPIALGGGITGHVIAYNMFYDHKYGATGWQVPSIMHHEPGISYTLMEGNYGVGFQPDNVHGTSHFGTVFRNRFTGRDNSNTDQTIPLLVYAPNRYFNFVGNVLGTSGYHKTYQYNPTSATDPGGSSVYNTSIYAMGWSSHGAKYGAFNNDLKSRTTTMRWGNWDVVSNATKWDSAEVPTGDGSFPNSVPSSQSLPASFYLSSQPTSWWGTPWGTPSWPPIGPDVTGGNLANTGGHANKTPAYLCWENTTRASNNWLNFDANSCYKGNSTPAPAPPSSVTAVPK